MALNSEKNIFGDKSATSRQSTALTSAVLALSFFFLYALVSLGRDARLGSAAYDLGIFDQAVQSYAKLHAPMTELKGPGFNLLGDHFSPMLAVLAPFYWIWPSARMLLVAQAALAAISVVPLTRLATLRLGRLFGTAVGIAYGLSWGIQGAIAFDFHEVVLGLPLLALSLAALIERRWTAGLLWALPLVLVKEDMGITVATIGCYLAVNRRWWHAGIAIGIGFGVFLTSTLVVVPALDHLFHTYRYWGVVTSGPGNTAAAPGVGDLLRLATTAPTMIVTPIAKIHLLLWTLGVTAFLALRSPLVLIAAPTLTWRLLSADPQYWQTRNFHYNVILMPIVFFAFVHASLLLRQSRRVTLRSLRWASVLAIVAVAFGALPGSAFWPQITGRANAGDRHVAAARAVVGQVPSGAPIQASNNMVPLVVDRCPTTLFPDVHGRSVDYVLVDTTMLGDVPLPPEQQLAVLRALPGRGFRLIAADDGIQLFRQG